MRQLIEFYKKGIDVTLLKVNLGKSYDQRLKQAQDLLDFSYRLQQSNPKFKK